MLVQILTCSAIDWLSSVGSHLQSNVVNFGIAIENTQVWLQLEVGEGKRYREKTSFFLFSLLKQLRAKREKSYIVNKYIFQHWYSYSIKVIKLKSGFFLSFVFSSFSTYRHYINALIRESWFRQIIYRQIQYYYFFLWFSAPVSVFVCFLVVFRFTSISKRK